MRLASMVLALAATGTSPADESKKEVLLAALHYLLLISEVDEVEIFKICLEYWGSLAADLYREF